MKQLTIVIPAYNEEEIIKENVEKVLNFLKGLDLKSKDILSWKLVVGEHDSEDKTIEILSLIPKDINFSSFSLKNSSKNEVIVEAWKRNPADYYFYMDADLPTNLKHIVELIECLNQGNDICIGSRWHEESKTERGADRTFISFIYRELVRKILNSDIKDFQCGFKAINRKVFDELIPKMKYLDGFMDTELLVRAENENYKVKEIPIEWKDERKSKFKISKSIFTGLVTISKIKKDLLEEKNAK